MSNSEGTYNLQAKIPGQYRPVIVKGRPLHNQPARSEFHRRRELGQTHLDLWVDGSLYPIDPKTNEHPKFSSIPQLLEFIGNGDNGLLGYIKNVEKACRSTSEQVRHQNITISFLGDRIDQLLKSCAEADKRWHIATQKFVHKSVIAAKARVSLRNVQEHCQSLESLQQHHETHHEAQLLQLQQSHEAQLLQLRNDINKATEENQKLHLKMERMKKTPFGFRSQVRPRHDIRSLSQQGGHARATRRLAREVIAPKTTTAIREANACGSKRKRLCGDFVDQVRTAEVITSLLSKTELQTMMESPKSTSTATTTTNQYLQKIGESVGVHAILETCDETGITQRGYEAIFKKFKAGATVAAKGLRPSCLPNPHSIRYLRLDMHKKLRELIGNYYSLHSSFEIPITKNSKAMKKITLNEHNSFFCDIEAVQRTMVRLYKITPEEVQGKPLIFVIKMDEAEVIHNQKLERISITFMNRALDDSITVDSDRYFSVQCEREIWPVGCFQVPKENYEILHAMLQLTNIPTIIQAQECGQLLKVDGVGDFKIQWHLAADMKTIKALYGLPSGPTASFCCIYCNQTKSKQTVVTAKEARTAANKRHPTWTGGLFAENIPTHPVHAVEDLARWHPIFPIPLDRVHICTMHAFNRICEKILHMHFQFVWTMRDKGLQKSAIEDLQRILSSIGMHGGDVEIFEDKDLSGKANSVPKKPSLNGGHARKLFQPSTLPGASQRVYQDLICAERNFMDNGSARHGRLEVWKSLEKLIPYFTELKLTTHQRESFPTLIEAFGRLFIKYFGEQSVTHYIHVLVKHGLFFVDKYGSLSVWSCQGMEYSHHAAKVAYHRHTQHGGSKWKTSPILQSYEHWYRIIQHRFHNDNDNDKRPQHEELNTSAEQKIYKRREVAIKSSCAAHSAAWRAQRVRVGSRWLPRPQPEDSSTP